MSSKKSWQSWLKRSLEKALAAESLQLALNSLANSIVKKYPQIQIWFAERLGRRHSFLTGAGKESYREPEKIELAGRYVLFLQNFSSLTEEEKNSIVALCRLVVALKQD